MNNSGLVVVVGKVGSGKTTLLYSILEETRIIEGERNICGTVSYVEQEPFIFSGTIKDNILFGKIYDEELFNEALEHSQLIYDFSTKGKPEFRLICTSPEDMNPEKRKKLERTVLKSSNGEEDQIMSKKCDASILSSSMGEGIA